MIDTIRLFADQPLLGAMVPSVSGVTRSSRTAMPGSAFVAAGGDELGHALEAVAAGATTIIAERPLTISVPQLLTPHARWSFASASVVAHGLDQRCPPLLGVTGTKGKTTTSWCAWAALGAGAARIGTTGSHDGAQERPTGMTTPAPEELHDFLVALPGTCPAVAMEVSSHAGDQQRLAGLRLSGLVFTGLEHDHLDYHATLAGYLAAKLAIIRLLRPGATCIINADDPRCGVVEHAVRCAGGVPLTLGHTQGAARLRRDGALWRLDYEGTDLVVPVALPGRFNAWNAAAGALLAACAGLVALPTALARLRDMPAVPGRLERCATRPLTYVDYAHTAQSLRLLIESLREAHPGRRLVVVFGCGGDRDRSKRGPMGVAAATADLAVLTTDNSRSEDPRTIADAVLRGLPSGTVVPAADVSVDACGVSVVLDRGTAIRVARRCAGQDGVVVVAGKGHETTQDIGGQITAWDDRAFIRALDSETT